MTTRREVVSKSALAFFLASFAAGCANVPVRPLDETNEPQNPEPEPEPGPAEFPRCNAIPACDSSVHIAPDSASLIITDPEVLARVPFQRVMEQLVTSSGAPFGAEEAAQRLFDTMNEQEYGKFGDVFHCNTHVDLPNTPSNFDTITCPRAEGKLAFSNGFFEDGDPDSFVPVAIVNRFDLTPINAMRCGQYRIIYAKRSGLTDPNDRVFIIFEPSLANPAECLEACRPIAQDWAALSGASPQKIGDFVEALFFQGVHGFAPVLSPSSFGPEREDTQGYGGGFEDGDEGGQIRVSMHMEDVWAMRELRLEESPRTGRFDFVPRTVKNNPTVSLFRPRNGPTEASNAARGMLLGASLPSLTNPDITRIQMFVPRAVNGFESMLGGFKKNDYWAATISGEDTVYLEEVESALAKSGVNDACPPGDPIDAEALLDRATTQSCAGCHAPKEMIGEDRSIGCGQVWPDSIGTVHVTEKGELSPALKDVFLPHRAKVLETYLQACDLDAMFESFQRGVPEKGF